MSLKLSLSLYILAFSLPLFLIPFLKLFQYLFVCIFFCNFHFLWINLSAYASFLLFPCNILGPLVNAVRAVVPSVHVRLFTTLWTVASQDPLSMAISRQEYWSGLSCPPPGDCSHPGTESVSLTSPALQVDSLSLVLPGKPLVNVNKK